MLAEQFLKEFPQRAAFLDGLLVQHKLDPTTIFGNNYGRRHLRDALEIPRRTHNKYPYDEIVSHNSR